MKPVAKRQPYASKDYWYYEARVFRGDEQVGESECFYPEEVDIMPGQHRQADIKHWAHNRMQLDKARRGELESFTIDLDVEEE